MGLSKTEDFTKTQNDLAVLAKACYCGDIVDELPLSQSTVSQHLNELKKAGLIKGDIDGPSVCYCIDERMWNKAKRMIGDLFESYQDQNCC